MRVTKSCHIGSGGHEMDIPGSNNRVFIHGGMAWRRGQHVRNAPSPLYGLVTFSDRHENNRERCVVNDKITRQLKWYKHTPKPAQARPPQPQYWDWRAVSRQMNRRTR